MPELREGNHADVSAFMFLTVHGQSVRPMVSDAQGNAGMGLQEMQDLVYFNSSGTKEVLKAKAVLMAHMYIGFIEKYYTKQREQGSENKSNADLIGEFAALMIQPEQTVFDLATLADDTFQFANEASADVPVAEVAEGLKISKSASKKLAKLGIQ